MLKKYNGALRIFFQEECFFKKENFVILHPHFFI